jgi:aryl-alcohol dehydrogenase-like predicted oxidoreductase
MVTNWSASANRYEAMPYKRCGRSGLKLPAISLGLWHNFGATASLANAREMILRAFDLGITHIGLANNYGPPPGSAEENFGRILKSDLARHRDELIISTKAGYLMWPGPYGEWGSRKYLLSSLDQSLKRMGLDHVDIFYSHRLDPDTPLEETMGALDTAVRQGKALYAGISSYSPEKTAEAAAILRGLGTPCLIHQPSYSMLNRWIERGLLDTLEKEVAAFLAGRMAATSFGWATRLARLRAMSTLSRVSERAGANRKRSPRYSRSIPVFPRSPQRSNTARPRTEMGRRNTSRPVGRSRSRAMPPSSPEARSLVTR